MAIAIDSRQHSQFNMGYHDSMRFSPHFTNPWASTAASQGQLYATSMPTANDSHRYGVQQQHHTPNVSAAYNNGATISAPPLASGIHSMDIDLYDRSGLQLSQDGLRPYGTSYATSTHSTAPSISAYAPTSVPQHYNPVSAAAYGYQSSDRRTSHPLNAASDAERQNFHDAVDASRGMLAMSQSAEITPRNIYGSSVNNSNSSRSSMDSYGFPSTHSAHSSISSASTYPSYYNSDASIGDNYSSASESVDMSSSRTLPRPNGLVGGNLPPAPQSMMGQFSSRMSSSSQKKHKCKVCDKRFTRPSSLQTHMYSHTGEKPFACDVEGCGRHFSVVSNLRRHRKVHKGESDHPSPDDLDD